MRASSEIEKEIEQLTQRVFVLRQDLTRARDEEELSSGLACLRRATYTVSILYTADEDGTGLQLGAPTTAAPQGWRGDVRSAQLTAEVRAHEAGSGRVSLFRERGGNPCPATTVDDLRARLAWWRAQLPAATLVVETGLAKAYLDSLEREVEILREVVQRLELAEVL